MKTRKKLIEVALPLDAINAASASEKGNPFLKGHPRNLHQWWARRPQATARAVIFSQMVDDPSEYVDTLLGEKETHRKAESELKRRLKEYETKQVEGEGADVTEPKPTLESVAADIERKRLFDLIEELVKWENTTNEEVLDRARAEIWQSWRRTCADNADHPHADELFNRDKLPAFHDPFAGGGALPLEAQRLGLEAYASDLNPVAVLINKAMIEIPPKFANQPPVNPEARESGNAFEREWKGAQGLAEDIRYYGKWMRDEAEKRIGHLYPKVKITEEMVKERPDLKKYLGRELTVIAWIWARTVKSPNPAFADVDVPLASTFMLSTKKGKEAYVEPVIEGKSYRFLVKVGMPSDPKAAKSGTKRAGSGSRFVCLMSSPPAPIPFDHIRHEGKAGRIGQRLMAVVLEGDRGRLYISPQAAVETSAELSPPIDIPVVPLPERALGFRVQEYGMTKWDELFTNRQLHALAALTNLTTEAAHRVEEARLALAADPSNTLAHAASEYGVAVATFLALSVDKFADYNNAICTWNPANQNVGHLFTKHAIPMAWDFPESSPIAGGLSIDSIADSVARSVSSLPALIQGNAFQHDAASPDSNRLAVVATDPPYFDNIGYADLSDFFYLWLRRSLKQFFPSLFSTVAVPKAEELIASRFRHGSTASGEAFFLTGMTQAMERMSHETYPGFPVAVYYAFKQSETRDSAGGRTAHTGWDTFLSAVIAAGLSVSGTWPVRTERAARSIGQGTNSLSSSIVLVCRPRSNGDATSTRSQFISDVRSELSRALYLLQRANIAPVDLAQAAIGPGMAVFTRYEKVLDAEGNPLTVRDALALINHVLGETLAQQEGDFDPDTRWALVWFGQNGFDEGEYGDAETLSKAKNTSVSGMIEAGILESKRGKVRLLRPKELPETWDPETDPRLTSWEVVHHLIRVLEKGGEGAAADLVVKLGAKAEIARELAYRLYTICERKKRAQEALAYNGLVQSWPEIVRLAQQEHRAPDGVQEAML